MDVKTYMTQKVVTTSKDVRVLEALDLMKKYHIRNLPVVQGNCLVGIVTEKQIAENMPSRSTSLSVHEINYLLTKTTVADIMTKEVITIHPDALLEEAAVTMREKVVSVLPVVEEDKLVGIITSSDIFEAFINVLGYYHKGIRIAVEVEDHVGELEKLSRLLNGANISVDQLAIYHLENQVQVVAQLREENIDKVTNLLNNENYKILSIIVKEGR